jgi:hypothetical protein
MQFLLGSADTWLRRPHFVELPTAHDGKCPYVADALTGGIAALDDFDSSRVPLQGDDASAVRRG